MPFRFFRVFSQCSDRSDQKRDRVNPFLFRNWLAGALPGVEPIPFAVFAVRQCNWVLFWCGNYVSRDSVDLGCYALFCVPMWVSRLSVVAVPLPFCAPVSIVRQCPVEGYFCESGEEEQR